MKSLLKARFLCNFSHLLVHWQPEASAATLSVSTFFLSFLVEIGAERSYTIVLLPATHAHQGAILRSSASQANTALYTKWSIHHGECLLYESHI